MNYSNLLTLSRVFLTPVVVVLLFPNPWVSYFPLSVVLSGLLYGLASLTDYWDGSLARKYGWKSRLGEFLDPLADKILTLSVFIALLHQPFLRLSWVLVALIVLRESMVTLLRIWAIHKNRVMKTERHGKIKTVSQIVFQSTLFLLIFHWSIVFELSTFQQFFPGSGPVGVEILDRFQEQALFYPAALYWCLQWLPMLLLTAVAGITLQSGVEYLRKNWGPLFKA